MQNIKALYNIMNKNKYNFDKSEFIISIILISVVVITQKNKIS